MTAQPPTPTGTAAADLLLLELSESTTAPSARGDRLEPAMSEFAARMTTVFVTTADEDGECDCSLRSGPPGFVHVLNERTLAYPEDRVAAGGRVEIDLLMVDLAADRFGLRVTGTASPVEDSVLRGEHPDLPAAAADHWMLVHVATASFGARAGMA